jgi:hypothetical protein
LTTLSGEEEDLTANANLKRKWRAWREQDTCCWYAERYKQGTEDALLIHMGKEKRTRSIN